jgi:signal peptidase I
MVANRRWIRVALYAAVLALALLAWVVLLPAKYGGWVSYLIIDGTSMEPVFHRGDLVVLREGKEYRVGDAVAYFEPELDSYVYHRIVSIDRGYFSLQGDNNDWIDTYRPVSEEIIGKEWMHLPRVGEIAQRLSLPIKLALVTGLGSVIGVVQKKKVRSPSRRNLGMFTRQILERTLQKNLGIKMEEIMMILGTLALVSFILGIFAYMSPVWRTVSREIPYTQQGEFSYSGEAPSDVYESNRIRSGDPLFLQLVCRIQAGFEYRFIGEGAEGLAGKYTLYAQINTPSGWKRKVILQPEQSFQGDTYQARTELDVCQFDRLIEEVNRSTGISESRYWVDLVAETSLSGKLQEKDFQADFTPKLTFMSDRLHLWLEEGDSDDRPLFVSAEDSIPDPYQEVNTLPFLNLRLGIPLARLLSVMGMGLSISTMIFLNKYYRGTAADDRDRAIRMKYGHMLVDVQGKNLLPSGTLLEVSSVDDLAKLAEKYDSMILHSTDGQFQGYLVQGNGLTYRFHVDEQPDKAWVSSLNQIKDEISGALSRYEFVVHYQPIVSFQEKRMVAAEALIRWNHPQRGLVSADQFIHSAFETGLIETLDGWMLKQGLSQLENWLEIGFPELVLSANLSLRALGYESFRRIIELIRASGLSPGSVQLEFTETDLIEASEEKLAFLDELKAMGISISMDNFSGRMPLNVLARLPITCLKIHLLQFDGAANGEIHAVVTLGISAARSLGLKVILEGVETEEQYQFFQGNDVYAIQGYLLGKPVSGDEMTQYLLKTKTGDGQVIRKNRRKK